MPLILILNIRIFLVFLCGIVAGWCTHQIWHDRRKKPLVLFAIFLALAFTPFPAHAQKTWKLVSPAPGGGGGAGGEVPCTYQAQGVRELLVPVTTTFSYIVIGGTSGQGTSVSRQGGGGGSSAIVKNGTVAAQGAGGAASSGAPNYGSTVQGNVTFNAGDKMGLYVGGGGGGGAASSHSCCGDGGAGWVGGAGGASYGVAGGSGGIGPGGIRGIVQAGNGGGYGSAGEQGTGSGHGKGGVAGVIELTYTSTYCWL